ncbi:NAD(P)/FAD-dependent oxidoreductase [Verrucomicrobiaceae bacterium 5K15]|uniref:NAD(P)/FAD-dependent oxidoreductase n=1 Tax=Oceaniferula flava TaxID=2800421 RepID=A0AAE2V8C3_9BACT|nr:NAD(P)/FAD-dependent oxidoreductase [Oceaniferula flavus]MBK1853378.1 NAD(P)/FAD-dependent oxidoreductase [Oceaniferula flavus]MBM1134683.1 NAD(P)/FAD-dependent oxidoreductase [Oceaniferula flavus]
MTASKHWDLIVVGGGAAGFFAAITCAEAGGGKVLILEKTPKLLGKVKISGGGRCNVTHACFEPKPLTEHYPRGHKSLIGPFHRWGAADTVQWFESRGVTLKTEADGRMFPITDSSQTVIDCLTQAARDAGVEIRTSTGVDSITPEEDGGFTLTTNQNESLSSRSVLLATGGTRLAAGAKLAQSLGHQLVPNVPSLFAFNIEDPRIRELPGVSVAQTEVSVDGMKLKATGPLLITHHGLSGPGILKLSAWGARDLSERDYRFQIKINWLPELSQAEIEAALTDKRQTWGKRRVPGHCPFEPIPKRLWNQLCQAAGISAETLWSQLNKDQTRKLVTELSAGSFAVSGKSINKDEFVTCGGVKLHEVNLKTMESKIQPGLYFAGEVLDIDGITGGFNFQNAWTSGHLAGMAVAAR